MQTMSNQDNTLQLDTLQLKRLSSKDSTLIPEYGEPVFVRTDEESFFVIGDGESTVANLRSSDNYFAQMSDSKNQMSDSIKDEGLKVCSKSFSPTNIVAISNGSLAGSHQEAARSDHTHKITATEVEKSLGSGDITVGKEKTRRIFVGTSQPTSSMGSDGDIYLRYDV